MRKSGTGLTLCLHLVVREGKYFIYFFTFLFSILLFSIVGKKNHKKAQNHWNQQTVPFLHHERYTCFMHLYAFLTLAHDRLYCFSCVSLVVDGKI